MNKIKLPARAATFAIAMVAFLFGAGVVCGQEASRTLERIYKIDERGNAEIEFHFQYNAAQWAEWKDQYGDHPDLMLRNVKYQLAAAVIDDFSLEKDDMHRSAVAKIKARCLAIYHGNGQFTLQVPKNMKLVTGSGSEWVFTSSSLENGGLVNVTDRVEAPRGRAEYSPNERERFRSTGVFARSNAVAIENIARGRFNIFYSGGCVCSAFTVCERTEGASHAPTAADIGH